MTLWVSVGLSGKRIVTEHVRVMRTHDHETRLFLSLLSGSRVVSITVGAASDPGRLAAVLEVKRRTEGK